MAVPKRNVSKTRKRTRRANKALVKPTLVKCPKCGEVIKPHRACPKCGFYKGKATRKEADEK